MQKPMFVWLGSGRARKRGVGGDGRYLDEATRAGLPVPPGAILLDEFYRFCRDAGLVAGAVERPVISDVELWHNTLFYSVRLPPFARPVVVRPTWTAAGLYPAANGTGDKQPINLHDPAAAAVALATVWGVAARAQAARADVLVLEAIQAEQRGWATLTEDMDELPPVNEGAADLRLPRLRGRTLPDAGLPPSVRRLQMLLRGVRRTFNPAPRRVAWADDGQICWLTSVAEQARETAHNAVAGDGFPE